MVLEHVDDITEKKRVQAEAMRSRHLTALGELAAGVAHEINNPINSVINYAQMLKNSTKIHVNISPDLPKVKALSKIMEAASGLKVWRGSTPKLWLTFPWTMDVD